VGFQLLLKVNATVVKVHLTSKYFLHLNKSLHLFETHCAFLSLFNPNLDFLEAVKVTKSGHHLLYDRASKGYGSIPCLTSQTFLHACLQRHNMTQISL